MKTLAPTTLEASTLSLTPGFSPVWLARRDGNRFNGFSCRTGKAAESLSENCVGSCDEGFWLWPRRRGRSIPAAGCDGRANAGHRQTTRRPEGFRGKGPLASLLVGRRPLQVSSLLAPLHRAFPSKTGLPRNFPTGSEAAGIGRQLDTRLKPRANEIDVAHPPCARPTGWNGAIIS